MLNKEELEQLNKQCNKLKLLNTEIFYEEREQEGFGDILSYNKYLNSLDIVARLSNLDIRYTNQEDTKIYLTGVKTVWSTLKIPEGIEVLNWGKVISVLDKYGKFIRFEWGGREENFTVDTLFLPKSLTYVEWDINIQNMFPNLSKLIFDKESKVLGLPDGFLKHCTDISEVVLPNSLGVLSRECFYCSGIETIELSDNLFYIKECAFTLCSKLQSISFGNKLLEIGDSAFRYCYSLTEVTIPASVVTIGNLAFEGCVLDTLEFLGDTQLYIDSFELYEIENIIVHTETMKEYLEELYEIRKIKLNIQVIKD